MKFELCDDVEFYHPIDCVWVPTYIISVLKDNEYLVAGYGRRVHANFLRKLNQQPTP